MFDIEGNPPCRCGLTSLNEPARCWPRSTSTRAVELVRQVCRIPSVLGDEGELAGFLSTVMEDAGFEAVKLQPVLPERRTPPGRSASARAGGCC